MGTWTADLGNGVFRVHDNEARVTCWVLYGYQKGGITCLPDSQVDGPKP